MDIFNYQGGYPLILALVSYLMLVGIKMLLDLLEERQEQSREQKRLSEIKDAALGAIGENLEEESPKREYRETRQVKGAGR